MTGGAIPPATDSAVRADSAVRLDAPEPSWAIDAEVALVGSGVAGLTAALRCAAAGLRTVIVTKALLDDGSTRWAQGGIAAALGEGDTPQQHLDDTLVAGAGLCDEAAVHTLVTEGPDAVRRLIASGAVFDPDEDGAGIALTREGGHHRRRIAHAGGDATGAEISRALVEAVRTVQREGTAAGGTIETIEHALVLDLLKDAEGNTAGVSLHVMGEGRHDGVGAVHAPAVVLATGGMGQIFSATTNPAVSTGDGVALALRAGAQISDLEFVQFHPTVLYLGPDAEGQQPLISEAVRGEGAKLVDADGERFMVGRHELAELAPRDIVAKGIMRRCQEQGAEHMYLDGRHFGARMWQERFPTILAACRAHGFDPVTEPIPVAPAAHYASGGVRTDLDGRTTVPGLYACGEVACTGVHGANRLASNSLLEGLVFAERIAADLTADFRAGRLRAGAPVTDRAVVPLPAAELRTAIQRTMTEGAGVLRSAASLAAAARRLAALHPPAAAADSPGPAGSPVPSASGVSAASGGSAVSDGSPVPPASDGSPGFRSADGAGRGPAEPGTQTWETANLLLVAEVLVRAATEREETRGCHWREDFPDRDDRQWRRHLVATLEHRADRTGSAHPVLRATESTAFPPVRATHPPAAEQTAAEPHCTEQTAVEPHATDTRSAPGRPTDARAADHAAAQE